MPAPKAGFIMFRFMLEIGRRSNLFPILKVIEVVNAAIAIGARLFWKFEDIVSRASCGSERMSPREISPAPDTVSVCSGLDPIPTEVILVPRSVAPVIRPIGEVPATPSVSMVA